MFDLQPTSAAAPTVVADIIETVTAIDNTVPRDAPSLPHQYGRHLLIRQPQAATVTIETTVCQPYWKRPAAGARQGYGHGDGDGEYDCTCGFE